MRDLPGTCGILTGLSAALPDFMRWTNRRGPGASRAVRLRMTQAPTFVRWFSDIGLGDVPLVGGKNASLGELYRELSEAGVRVPNGFAITAEAYRYFMRSTGLDTTVASLATGDRKSVV